MVFWGNVSLKMRLWYFMKKGVVILYVFSRTGTFNSIISSKPVYNTVLGSFINTAVGLFHDRQSDVIVVLKLPCISLFFNSPSDSCSI